MSGGTLVLGFVDSDGSLKVCFAAGGRRHVFFFVLFCFCSPFKPGAEAGGISHASRWWNELTHREERPHMMEPVYSLQTEEKGAGGSVTGKLKPILAFWHKTDAKRRS